MSIPAPPSYNQQNEQQQRNATEQALRTRQVLGDPVILISPNGTRFTVSVDDAGNLTATAA